MQSAVNIEELQRSYNKERQNLENNLNALFHYYKSRLTGSQSDALIKVIRTGESLMKDMDFLYLPPFFVAISNDTVKSVNYTYITELYQQTNTLMNLLMQSHLDQSAINAAKNTLENTIKLRFPVGNTCDRIGYGIGAFYSALITLAGIALIAAALATPVGWVTIPLLGFGLFGSILGGAKLTYAAKHAHNSGKKQADEFFDVVDNFVNHVTSPTSSL